MDDIFESSLNLEQTHLKEGFGEGYKDGLIAGEEEASQVGSEVGEERGFYGGRVGVWSSTARTYPTRVRKAIGQLEEIQEIMNGLRLKFRAVCASTGLKLDYNGYPKSSSESIDI